MENRELPFHFAPGTCGKRDYQCHNAKEDIHPGNCTIHVQPGRCICTRNRHEVENTNDQEQHSKECTVTAGAFSHSCNDADQSKDEVNGSVNAVRGECAENDIAAQSPDAFCKQENADND